MLNTCRFWTRLPFYGRRRVRRHPKKVQSPVYCCKCTVEVAHFDQTRTTTEQGIKLEGRSTNSCNFWMIWLFWRQIFHAKIDGTRFSEKWALSPRIGSLLCINEFLDNETRLPASVLTGRLRFPFTRFDPGFYINSKQNSFPQWSVAEWTAKF